MSLLGVQDAGRQALPQINYFSLKALRTLDGKKNTMVYTSQESYFHANVTY